MDNTAEAGGTGRGRIDIAALWNEYHERVYHRLCRLVRNAEDAQDLTDCAFVRVWQRQALYDPSRYTVSAWLYLNARTVAVAFLRRKREKALRLDLIPEDRGPSCAGPEELYETAEARARVWQAVDELPEKERFVLRAHYHDGYSWQEVADQMGVCVRTVKFHASRGYVLLRAKLAKR